MHLIAITEALLVVILCTLPNFLFASSSVICAKSTDELQSGSRNASACALIPLTSFSHYRWPLQTVTTEPNYEAFDVLKFGNDSNVTISPYWTSVTMSPYWTQVNVIWAAGVADRAVIGPLGCHVLPRTVAGLCIKMRMFWPVRVMTLDA